MEEIYSLLQERIENIDDIKKKFHKSDNSSNAPGIDIDITSAEASDLSQQISQAKRMEKLRIIKENELMEVIFSLRSFDLKQKLRFQAKSYDIMKLIRQDFNYEKYKHSGETKDIAKLYLNFFTYLRMDGKINDLKRAYANNKFMGYPIISALMKWLVEVAREYFQNVLKEKSRDLVNSMSAKTKKTPIQNPNQKVLQPLNVSRPQSISKARGQIPGQPQLQSQSRILTDQSKKKISPEIFGDEMIGYEGYDFSKSGSPKSSEYKAVLISLAKGNKTQTKEHAKFVRSQTNPKESGLFDPNPIVDPLLANNPNFKDGKIVKRAPEFYKQNGNVVQIYIPVQSQNNTNLDVIEDLDSWQVTTMIPQLFNLYKNIKKNKDTHLVTIDLEKKKELINSVYRNLYGRNLEIERSVTNFQLKMQQGALIDYEPVYKPKKGENYCETYSINFLKRFPSLLNQSSAVPTSNGHSSKYHKSKSEKESSPYVAADNQGLIQDTTMNDPSTLCIGSPKNVRSASLKMSHHHKDSSESPMRVRDDEDANGNQILGEVQGHEYNPNTSQSNYHDQMNENQQRMTEHEESYTRKKANSGTTFGYRSEHHFRIVKKRATLFQESKTNDEKPPLPSAGTKPCKLDHQMTWGNSEDNGAKSEFDNPSERTAASQTISSRRELSNMFNNKNHVADPSTFQKIPKGITNIPEKMRSWSTEKSRPQYDEPAKMGVQVRSSYRQPSDASPLEYREERSSAGFDKIQLKTLYKSHLTSPKNDEEDGPIVELPGYKKLSVEQFSKTNLPESKENVEEPQVKKGKHNLVKSKSPSTIPRLYPKHTKHYSEPSHPEGQKVKET